MLVRDPEDRVLLCQLTYKRDWDLPGGVVEVHESPRLAVARELEEELAVDIAAGALLLTDWLPPWSGWDDALCLVFDGGVHDRARSLSRWCSQPREIRAVHFCTLERGARALRGLHRPPDRLGAGQRHRRRAGLRRVRPGLRTALRPASAGP